MGCVARCTADVDVDPGISDDGDAFAELDFEADRLADAVCFTVFGLRFDGDGVDFRKGCVYAVLGQADRAHVPRAYFDVGSSGLDGAFAGVMDAFSTATREIREPDGDRDAVVIVVAGPNGVSEDERVGSGASQVVHLPSRVVRVVARPPEEHLEGGVAIDLDVDVVVDFDLDGLVCAVVFPWIGWSGDEVDSQGDGASVNFVFFGGRDAVVCVVDGHVGVFDEDSARKASGGISIDIHRCDSDGNAVRVEVAGLYTVSEGEVLGSRTLQVSGTPISGFVWSTDEEREQCVAFCVDLVCEGDRDVDCLVRSVC